MVVVVHQQARALSLGFNPGVPRRRNFLSVKVFRMDLEADFKRLFVIYSGC
jgi:hypothetical protein